MRQRDLKGFERVLRLSGSVVPLPYFPDCKALRLRPFRKTHRFQNIGELIDEPVRFVRDHRVPLRLIRIVFHGFPKSL